MTNLPEFLLYGENARLFPVVADTSREQRTLSIFLAVLTQVPAFARASLGSLGVRIGKRARISTFTEVTFKNDANNDDRPDGLIVVQTGRSTWAAIVEAKIGKAALDASQVERYLRLARDNKIDAVITISNDFAARPEHSPLAKSIQRIKQLTSRVHLYHWSWASLATHCEVLAYQGISEDSEQHYLIRQLSRFFSHPTTGIERFTQMGPAWKTVVQTVASGAPLAKNTPGIEDVVASWIAEERDLCLHMTSRLNRSVSARIERKHATDPKLRLEDGVSALISTQTLTSTVCVPDCASDITIRADLARRSLSVSMTVKARGDRKSTRARVNWLLGMLKADDPRLRVQAHWPGRATDTSEGVEVLREHPDRLQTDNPAMLPRSFEIALVEVPGARRFGGQKAFIEDLERIVPEFYDLVGVTLKAWRPPPPKPVLRDGELSDTEALSTGIKPNTDESPEADHSGHSDH